MMRISFSNPLVGLGVGLALFAQPALSAPEALTVEQQDQLLELVDDLEKTAVLQLKSGHAKVLGILRTGAGSSEQAVALFLDCVQEVDFTRESRKFTEFQEWRKRNLKRVREPVFAQSLQLELQYLLLTMGMLHVDDQEGIIEMMPNLLTYLDRLASMDEVAMHGKKPLLFRPLDQSIFVRRYEIQTKNLARHGWVMAPGKLGEIYEKFVMPNVVLQNDPVLLAQVWERRIRHEQLMAKNFDREEPFNELGLTALTWARAKDFHAIGNRKEGILTMIKIIQASTEHPDVLKWIKELRELVKKAPRAEAAVE